jgi:hypothetical protein
LKTIIKNPLASRTFDAIINLGYNFNTAVSDLIDNSISAKATKIYILLDEIKGKRIFRMLDNGYGMSSTGLEEAMRLGSEAGEYGVQDLGKFGFGMKSASLSQCTKLIVLTREKESKNLSGFQWDLDHVRIKKDWALQQYEDKEIKSLLSSQQKLFQENFDGFKSTLLNTPGTLILWDNFRFSENHLDTLIDRLLAHIGLTFHRFIEGKVVDPVKIFINGALIKAVDPFCKKYEQTIDNGEKKFQLESSNKKLGTAIGIHSYIIPSKLEVGKSPKICFPNKKEHEESLGAKSWNESQGFYIYRNNRVIRYGGWNGVRQTEPHIVTSRISIDLNTSHDELFKVTVDKSKIIFPAEFKDYLQKAIVPWNKKAHERSRSGSAKIKNPIRKIESYVSEFTKHQLEEHRIAISKGTRIGKVVVKNPIGEFVKQNLPLHHVEKMTGFESKKLGVNNVFWESYVDPTTKKLIVLLNEDHPFYKHVYSPEKEKSSGYIDIFCLTMAFVELRCGTESNLKLLQDIKLFASEFLTACVKKKIF